MTDTLLDYIHREAFPKVVETKTLECGCIYETMQTHVRLTYCPKHTPPPEPQPDGDDANSDQD